MGLLRFRHLKRLSLAVRRAATGGKSIRLSVVTRVCPMTALGRLLPVSIESRIEMHSKSPCS